MPWHCRPCNEHHGDQFQNCWKCSADRSGATPEDCLISEDVVSIIDEIDLQEGCLPFDEIDCAPVDSSDAHETEPEPEIEPGPPLPYLSRLNRYFGRPEETVIPEYDRSSKMPLYMATIVLVRNPGKAADYIRQILERIRETIRSCKIRA